MVSTPKTTPRMISLSRPMEYPRGLLGSSSSSVVRRRRNLRATSLASISGLRVLLDAAMASKAEMAGEGTAGAGCDDATNLRGDDPSGEEELPVPTRSDWLSSSRGSAGASLDWRRLIVVLGVARSLNFYAVVNKKNAVLWFFVKVLIIGHHFRRLYAIIPPTYDSVIVS
jgi:hypothetical protein